ncbi:unnamed protein product [Symbiodinium sp. CCMP2592]|nr:unnamed protein product [Symbiodinium sp. CCMP2592]
MRVCFEEDSTSRPFNRLARGFASCCSDLDRCPIQLGSFHDPEPTGACPHLADSKAGSCRTLVGPCPAWDLTVIDLPHPYLHVHPQIGPPACSPVKRPPSAFQFGSPTRVPPVASTAANSLGYKVGSLSSLGQMTYPNFNPFCEGHVASVPFLPDARPSGLPPQPSALNLMLTRQRDFLPSMLQGPLLDTPLKDVLAIPSSPEEGIERLRYEVFETTRDRLTRPSRRYWSPLQYAADACSQVSYPVRTIQFLTVALPDTRMPNVVLTAASVARPGRVLPLDFRAIGGDIFTVAILRPCDTTVLWGLLDMKGITAGHFRSQVEEGRAVLQDQEGHPVRYVTLNTAVLEWIRAVPATHADEPVIVEQLHYQGHAQPAEGHAEAVRNGDLDEHSLVQVSSFSWGGEEAESRAFFSVFDTTRHVTLLPRDSKATLRDVVAFAVSSAPFAVRAVQILVHCVENLPRPQLLLFRAGARLDFAPLPWDLRPSGGPIKTVLHKQGENFHSAIQSLRDVMPESVQLCEGITQGQLITTDAVGIVGASLPRDLDEVQHFRVEPNLFPPPGAVLWQESTFSSASSRCVGNGDYIQFASPNMVPGSQSLSKLMDRYPVLAAFSWPQLLGPSYNHLDVPATVRERRRLQCPHIHSEGACEVIGPSHHPVRFRVPVPQFASLEEMRTGLLQFPDCPAYALQCAPATALYGMRTVFITFAQASGYISVLLPRLDQRGQYIPMMLQPRELELHLHLPEGGIYKFPRRPWIHGQVIELLVLPPYARRYAFFIARGLPLPAGTGAPANPNPVMRDGTTLAQLNRPRQPDQRCKGLSTNRLAEGCACSDGRVSCPEPVSPPAESPGLQITSALIGPKPGGNSLNPQGPGEGRCISVPTPFGRRQIDVPGPAPPGRRESLKLDDLLPDKGPRTQAHDAPSCVAWAICPEIVDLSLASHDVKHLHQDLTPLCREYRPFTTAWRALPAWNGTSACDELLVFTDGSFFTARSHATWSIIVIARIGCTFARVGFFADWTEVATSEQPSAFDGEVEALLHAVALACAQPGLKVSILSDCSSALLVAEGQGGINLQCPACRALAGLLLLARARGVDLSFQKVPAHSGNAFNDMADVLAKQVGRHTGPSPWHVQFEDFYAAVIEQLVERFWMTCPATVTHLGLPALTPTGTWGTEAMAERPKLQLGQHVFPSAWGQKRRPAYREG